MDIEELVTKAVVEARAVCPNEDYARWADMWLAGNHAVWFAERVSAAAAGALGLECVGKWEWMKAIGYAADAAAKYAFLVNIADRRLTKVSEQYVKQLTLAVDDAANRAIFWAQETVKYNEKREQNAA